MAEYRVQRAAVARLNEIFSYTKKHWGEAQARRYIDGLFTRFKQIAEGEARATPIPAEFEVTGFYTRYERHYIYWKVLKPGQIGIVTVLHERMHQLERFKKDEI